MIESIKRFFNKEKESNSGNDSRATEHDIRVATCALFVEMARIDEKFTPSEVETIISILKENMQTPFWLKPIRNWLKASTSGNSPG